MRWLTDLFRRRIGPNLAETHIEFRFAGRKLLLDVEPQEGGLAAVDLRGQLTEETAAMMMRWFVPLRARAFAIDLDVSHLARFDPAAVPTLLRLGRQCTASDVRLRIIGRTPELRRSKSAPVPALPRVAAPASRAAVPPIRRRRPSTRERGIPAGAF
ncbi:MAG: hypothetical protein CMJ83_22310 [Planctomycetes bacterium]|nr:hypothetical protein [Planctomycetota bacterium]